MLYGKKANPAFIWRHFKIFSSLDEARLRANDFRVDGKMYEANKYDCVCNWLVE